MTRLPLDPIRTFSIAARTQSFARAADRLSITSSAVSHQIRALEASLGTRLFDRQGRTVRLNATGASFLRAIEPALHAIDGAAAKLSDQDATRGPLVIASAAMFANCFLSQSLPDLIASYPALACRVDSLDNDAVLAHETADVGLVFGNGSWRDRWSLPLGSVRYAPVCSPRLMGGHEVDETSLVRLLDQVVIHIDDGDEWRRWATAAGLAQSWMPQRQLFTNDVSFALTIAANGGGVTLASDLLAGAYLRTGSLIKPSTVSIAVEGAWHVSARRDKVRAPRTQLFVRWLAERLQLPEPSFDELAVSR